MPPKPAPGKKGKDDQEDFSDVPSLPPLNYYIFSLLYKNFPTTELREKLAKMVQDKMPQERVKVLTREDIIAYGKAKQIILESAQQAALPQDDPRSKMTEDDQIAKAAFDKLFEMQVHARRAKKEKLQKLEEESKAQSDQQPQPLDPDFLDVMIQIVDFPNTLKEATALSKLGQTVQCVFDINYLNQPPNEEDETVLENQREIYPIKVSEQEQAYTQKVLLKLSELKEARAQSNKGSSIRNLGIFPLPYEPYQRVEYKTNADGEEIESKVDPEPTFQADVLRNLENYGALFIKYQRFKEKVTLVPLVPDKMALYEMNQIDYANKDYEQWLADVDQKLQVSSSQKDLQDPTQQEQIMKQKEQLKQEVEGEKQARKQEHEERRKKLEELKQKMKFSLDDDPSRQTIDMDRYEKSFIKKNEIKNSVSSIMSSMVTQLQEQKKLDTLASEDAQNDGQDANTAADSLDDIFSQFSKDVSLDLNLNTKSSLRDSLENPQFLQPEQYSRKKRKGTESLGRNKTNVGEVEYQEELDAAKTNMLKLQNDVPINDERNAQDICIRTKEIYNNLVLPGQNRDQMPPIPTKSQRLRNKENPSIYPFCTLPIEDAERAFILKQFQDLIKTNFIDEGQPVESKHHKYKIFERYYESHMKPEILRQVMGEALLSDPDVATQYFERKDSLLVALYNKVSFNRQNPSDPDGQREWRAQYRVMPDFENWVKYFSDQILSQELVKNPSKSQLNPTSSRLQLDEDMIPSQMLDIDDQKVQNIQENSVLMYPEHNGVLKVDNFQIGGKLYKKSLIQKDNLKFGLREASKYSIPESEKEYGLASYQKTGDTELWMHFENGTKLMVENIVIQPNEQRLIRIDPPKPTPEEIAAREEAIKQAQAAAAKQKGKNASALSNVQIEEYKEPEPTWEPEPFNHLDSYFDEYRQQTAGGPIISSTLQNGLIIQHLYNGDIIQMCEDLINDPTQLEKDRVYTGRGLVIRQLKNRDAEILFSNGYKAVFNKEDMSWVLTNNKGMRRKQKDGVQWDIDSIPCAIETDAVTNARMMIREDNVVTIHYLDGAIYCQHSDGTQFRTSSDHSQIRIEKEGFAPVVVKQSYVDFQYPEDQEQNRMRYTAIDRSLSNQVTECHFPDGTVTETFYDIKNLEQGNQCVRHIFRRPDFTVLIADDNGDFNIISSNTRSAMNEVGHKVSIGKDTDYAYELSRQESDPLSKGVFYCNINSEPGLSYISTVDDKFRYVLTYDLQLLKETLNNDVSHDITNRSIIPRSERSIIVDGREIEETGEYKYPFTKHYIYPRFFLVNSDGSGHELLSKEQLEYYFRVQKQRQESLKQRKIVMVGSTSAKSHYFLTKVKTLEDKERELQLIKNSQFPQNAQYVLKRLFKEKEKIPGPTTFIPDQYQFRQIFEFQELEGYKQEAFYEDLLRFKEWKQSQSRYDSEFGITWVPTKDQQIDYRKIEDEEYFAKRIILRILRERRNKRAQFQPEEFKKAFIHETQHSEELSEYHQRQSQLYDRADSSSRGNVPNSSTLDKQASILSNYEQQNMELWRQKKKASAEAKVKQKLADIQLMLNTPQFIPNYFKSKPGQHFTRNNPEKPPSTEVIMRMSQRINRSQHNTEKNPSQLEGYSQKSGQSPGHFKEASPGDNQMADQDKDNPIVALEPEEQLKQPSGFMGTKKTNKDQTVQGPKPSLYLQEQMYVQQREQEQLLKAEEYHVVKTKDFNVIGRLRQEKPEVDVLKKSTVQADLNEKFITTECIADRRIKISSMAGRQYINAPSVEQVRKQGQHQMILSAINKKQTFAELINQANSMVTSVLHDPLKRALNILPENCMFGTCQAGVLYELVFTIQNEDSLSQRITIKPTQDKRIQVRQEKYGPIAPGWTRNVIVTIKSNPDDEGNVKEDIQIVTKHDIYKIPVEAQILPYEKFRQVEEENQKLGKRTQNSRLRQRLTNQIQEGKKMHQEHMDQVESLYNQEYEPKRNWIETTGSDSKLPKLPQINQRQLGGESKKK